MTMMMMMLVMMMIMMSVGMSIGQFANGRLVVRGADLFVTHR